MGRILKYTVITMVVIVLLSYFLPSQLHKPLHFESNSATTLTLAEKENRTNNTAVDSSNKITTLDSYQSCETFLANHASEYRVWFRAEYESWGKYLQQGFSLDDVTLAVAYFGNSNFAASFRANYLKSNSGYAHLNKEISENFFQQIATDMADYLKKNAFSVGKQVPSPYLTKFLSLPEAQKRDLIKEQNVTVDDIAYILDDRNVEEADIILLLSKVKTPNAVVGYGYTETISLIDYAAKNARPKVLIELLKKGIKPTHDFYLASTMEWALWALDRFQYDPDKLLHAVEVVKALIPHNAAARFHEHSDTSLKGRFPRHFYEFEESFLNSLLQEHDLDLMLIPVREAADTFKKEKNELAKLLEKQRQQHLVAKFNTMDLEQVVHSCENKIDTIDKKWAAKSMHSLEREYKEKYGEEHYADHLIQVDPVFIDHFIKQNTNSFRTVIHEEAREVLNEMPRTAIDKALKYTKNIELSESHKNWVMRELLYWDVNNYTKLRSSHLYSRDIPYYSYLRYDFTNSFITEMLDAGIDLTGEDDRGKTLLFYAVNHGALKLVEQLLELNYPFHLGSAGQDPLHIALYIDRRGFSLDDLPQLVELLMAFQPNIDEFHRQRMAVLRLYYPESYKTISTRFPQLAVKEDQELPKVKFERFY